jgi:hypothetical protein
MEAVQTALKRLLETNCFGCLFVGGGGSRRCLMAWRGGRRIEAVVMVVVLSNESGNIKASQASTSIFKMNFLCGITTRKGYFKWILNA